MGFVGKVEVAGKAIRITGQAAPDGKFGPAFEERLCAAIDEARPAVREVLDSDYHHAGGRFGDTRRITRRILGSLDGAGVPLGHEYTESEVRGLAIAGLLEAASADHHYTFEKDYE